MAKYCITLYLNEHIFKIHLGRICVFIDCINEITLIKETGLLPKTAYMTVSAGCFLQQPKKASSKADSYISFNMHPG